MATGTASGKSLAYQLPALTALLTQPKACVLYLAPTKALGADQLGSLESLKLDGLRAAPYDGDTPLVERDWARAHANWVLTNPDMLHRGVLPAHARWARVLRRLAYVVVDECHAYRGVFGSHVALVLRRLIRLCRRYGSEPVFVFASATTADPAVAAGGWSAGRSPPSPRTGLPGRVPTSCSGSRVRPPSATVPHRFAGPRLPKQPE